MEIKWHKLEELAGGNFRDIPNSSGIYFVRWSKDGKPVPIGRLGGVDPKGLVYVGCAYGRKGMKYRIRHLWKGINGNADVHTIGMTIIFCKVSETINPSEYEIAWEELKTREDAIGQESASIGLYAEKYKEPLPFNLMIKRELFVTCGIGKCSEKSLTWYEPDEFATSIIDERESTHK